MIASLPRVLLLASMFVVGSVWAAVETAPDHSVSIFILQLVLLLTCGRLLGEVMQRIGQPAVMGQLVAGIVLGPSLFGLLAPELREVVFPEVEVQEKMLDAVSQLGILLLLLVTGMETDLPSGDESFTI